MICQHAELQLNALADRELPPWQALRVRRHLAACPACAAEYADIRRLGASVQAWRDVPAPPALGPRILAALPPSAAFQTNRRAFPIRPAAVGLAGVAAAVAAAFWFLPGQPGQPTIAFADVVKAMANVKTRSSVEDTTYFDQNGKVVLHLLERQWIRRNPPAIATINLLKPAQPGETHGEEVLEDGRGLMAVMPDGGYSLSSPGQDVAKSISGYIELSTQTLLVMAQGDARYGKNGLIQGEKTILNGRLALKFEDTLHIQRPTPEDEHTIVWIDQKTRRLVRLTGETRVNGKVTMSGSSTDFHYDETPPPGVFDIVPPLGARVVDERTLRVYRQGQPNKLIK